MGARRARAAGRDTGAVAVEAALLAPLLILFALGVIELALLLRSSIAATTLAREGARTASAEPRLVGFTTDAARAVTRSAATLTFDRIEVWVYEAQGAASLPPGGGTNPASCTAANRCVRYSGWVDPTGFATVSGAWDPRDINACIADAGADYVGVYVRARHDWLFNLFGGANTTVTGRTVMKFEPVIPRPTAPDFQRTCK
jgi:hypothetical protein